MPETTVSLELAIKPAAAVVVKTAPKVESKVSGIKGEKGDTGAQGVQGVPGADSTVPGPQGDTGPQGVQGDQGPQGIQGVPGNDGADGNDGATGLQGDQGLQGVQGVPGNDGIDGNDGAQGIQGVPGNDGADGADGAQGVQGPQGDPGADGSDATVNAANVAGAGAVMNIGDETVAGLKTFSDDVQVGGTTATAALIKDGEAEFRNAGVDHSDYSNSAFSWASFGHKLMSAFGEHALIQNSAGLTFLNSVGALTLRGFDTPGITINAADIQLLHDTSLNGNSLNDVANLRMVGTAPAIYFDESDQTDPAGEYRIDVSDDLLRFIRSATVLMSIDNSGKVLIGDGGIEGTSGTIDFNDGTFRLTNKNTQNTLYALGLTRAGAKLWGTNGELAIGRDSSNKDLIVNADGSVTVSQETPTVALGVATKGFVESAILNSRRGTVIKSTEQAVANTTATLLPATELADRVSIVVENRSTEDVMIGDSNVSATLGTVLKAGAKESYDLDAGLFAYQSSGGSINLHINEIA